MEDSNTDLKVAIAALYYHLYRQTDMVYGDTSNGLQLWIATRTAQFEGLATKERENEAI